MRTRSRVWIVCIVRLCFDVCLFFESWCVCGFFFLQGVYLLYWISGQNIFITFSFLKAFRESGSLRDMGYLYISVLSQDPEHVQCVTGNTSPCFLTQMFNYLEILWTKGTVSSVCFSSFQPTCVYIYQVFVDTNNNKFSLLGQWSW
jgi:hypothetical protein